MLTYFIVYKYLIINITCGRKEYKLQHYSLGCCSLKYHMLYKKLLHKMIAYFVQSKDTMRSIVKISTQMILGGVAAQMFLTNLTLNAFRHKKTAATNRTATICLSIYYALILTRNVEDNKRYKSIIRCHFRWQSLPWATRNIVPGSLHLPIEIILSLSK